MSTDSIRWTESEIFARLRHVFPAPAHVILPQVRNGTGYARAKTRTADAIVLSVWPSRGLWMAGVEIKVSKHDWKKELAHPDKAAEIQKYCTQWYIASQEAIIDSAEVPKTWGQIVVKANTAKIAKPAPELTPRAPDMLLVASILRAAAKYTVPASSVDAKIREAVAKAKSQWDFERKNERDDNATKVKRFEEASGVSLADMWHAGEIGHAVRFVREVGLVNIHRTVNEFRQSAQAIIKCLDEAEERMKETAGAGRPAA